MPMLLLISSPYVGASMRYERWRDDGKLIHKKHTMDLAIINLLHVQVNEVSKKMNGLNWDLNPGPLTDAVSQSKNSATELSSLDILQSAI